MADQERHFGPGGRRAGRFGALLVLPALLALGSWPFVSGLSYWPQTRDATLWILNGQPDNAGWSDWVFRTAHFRVSYRPLTALSFTANGLLSGLDTTSYRAVDLLLHLATAALLYALYRRIAPGLPAWGGLVVVAVFLAHPLAEIIVPHLARRSYPLSTTLGLAGLILLPHARSRATVGTLRLVGAGLLLGLAVLANETAVVCAGMAPVLLLHGYEWRWSRWWAVAWRSVVALIPLAVVIWVRYFLVEGMGGYEHDVDAAERVGDILWATWITLTCMDSTVQGWIMRGLELTLLGLALAGYVTLALAATRRARPGRFSLVVPLIWLLGFTVLFAPLGVWFYRQMYPMVVPFALLLGVSLAWTWSADWPRRRRLLALLPQVFVLAWVGAHGALIRGPDPGRAAVWRANDRMLRNLYATVRELDEPSRVFLVVPDFRAPMREEVIRLRAREKQSRALGLWQPSTWVEGVLDDSRIKLVPYVVFRRNPLQPGKVRFERVKGRPALAVQSGADLPVMHGDSVHHRAAGPERIWLDKAPAMGLRRTYVYVDDGAHQELIPVKRRRPRGVRRP